MPMPAVHDVDDAGREPVRPLGAALGEDVHAGAGGGELHGVVDEVPEDLRETAAVAGDGEPLGRLDGDGRRRAPRPRTEGRGRRTSGGT